MDLVIPQFAMIVYVNRSGSTFLSRQIGDRFDDVFVFPEMVCLLHLLVERSRGRVLEKRELFELFSADPRIDALALERDALRDICNKVAPGDLPTLLVELAAASAGRRGHRAIFFKFETLLYMIDDVAAAVPGLKTIHLVRDPRAVVNSMLKSDLPEKPGFDMARGSVVFASRHWRDYVGRASRSAHAHPLLTVRYEALGAEAEDVFGSLSAFLDLPLASASSAPGAYRISHLDGALHANVFRPFLDDRADAWRSELSPRAIAVVETICRTDMERFGYVPSSAPLSRAGLSRAYASHAGQMLRHGVRTLAVYARREDKVAALVKRYRVFRSKKGRSSAS